MSREFKFRVWSFLEKAFYYFTLEEGVPSGIAGGISEPQQYTGLSDDYGNPIYEGDIVEFHSGYPNRSDESFDKSKAVVRFEDGAFWPRPITEHCDDDWHTYKLTDIKVIGNLMKHPELLK